MRQIIRDLIEICSVNLEIKEPIYEFGSAQVQEINQQKFADLRPFFPNKIYVGTDYQEGEGVDMILDLHNIALNNNIIGTAICVDTLEHTEYPHKALQEICRTMQYDGYVIIASVMNFHIHNKPDYWRFTTDGFNSLLKPFKNTYVIAIGEEIHPHTIIGIGSKNSTIPSNLINLLVELKANYETPKE